MAFAISLVDLAPCKGKDIIEKLAVHLGEGVSGLLIEAARKGRVGFEVVADVGAATLHKVTRELTPDSLAARAIEISWQVGEFLIEETQQLSKCFLVSAVRRCGDEHKMARPVSRHSSQQLEPLLSSTA